MRLSDMWTCIECEHEYDESTGDMDERMCNECLDDDDDISELIQELHPQPIIDVEEVEYQ